MRSVVLSLVAFSAAHVHANFTYRNKTACDVINQHELPPECSCNEPGPYSVMVECEKEFQSKYFNDTIGMKVYVDPCNKLGSRISLDVIEKEHHIEYPITGIRAGESKNVPLPGLSVAVPGIGNVGLDAAILIAGNPDSLILKVGLNACAAMAQKEVCASSIPGLNRVLPWYVLEGTYSFGHICDANSTLAKE